MAQHAFNGLSVELPDGWEDQTIITFVSPPEALHAAPLTGQQPDTHRASVVVKRVTLTEVLRPVELAEAYEHIHVHATGGRVVDRGTIDLGDNRIAATRAYEIDGPEGTMKQLHVHLELGGQAYAVFGTAPADLNFAKLEKVCVQAAKSLKRG